MVVLTRESTKSAEKKQTVVGERKSFTNHTKHSDFIDESFTMKCHIFFWSLFRGNLFQRTSLLLYHFRVRILAINNPTRTLFKLSCQIFCVALFAAWKTTLIHKRFSSLKKSVAVTTRQTFLKTPTRPSTNWYKNVRTNLNMDSNLMKCIATGFQILWESISTTQKRNKIINLTWQRDTL